MYRGRLAPSPTGSLHLGHAQTFLTAQRRAREHGGELFLRVEDLDRARCKPENVSAMLEDLRWCGLRWTGEPVFQSQRNYLPIWQKLRDVRAIFPCACSRKDVLSSAAAPHEEEAVYPGTCRGKRAEALAPGEVNWRFRVPDGEKMVFFDERLGWQKAVAGEEFGDFIVWRKDGVPAYELAVVADDAAMEITEVVRGEDLVRSTFRQILLYRALGWKIPAFYHAPLVCDSAGRRLAKRSGSLTLQALRAAGEPPPQEMREADAPASG